MIKKLLVALDPDSDTTVASQYAVEIARRCDAQITGLAVIDLDTIASETRGGGIGSMYYAEKLRANLTDETRAKAKELLDTFHNAMDTAGATYSELVEEGVPVDRILEDTKYHDMLIIGKDPHFFYGQPKKETEILPRVVRETVTPTLVVGDVFQPVRRVLVAYDGSNAAARTLHAFVSLQPFGSDLDVEIVHIYERNQDESQLLLKLAASYMEAHGFRPSVRSMEGDNPRKQIARHAVDYRADLVVAGAHSKTKILGMSFGSTTDHLLKDHPAPLFLDF